jgi:hypothetical protein
MHEQPESPMNTRNKQPGETNPGRSWDRSSDGDGFGSSGWRLAGLLALWIVGMVWLVLPGMRMNDGATGKHPEPASSGVKTAEDVAKAFLQETDPAKRLEWVRHPDEVKTRLAEYPDEARQQVGKVTNIPGRNPDGSCRVTAFMVKFPSQNHRLLEVVRTPAGPKVDWDAYARYSTEPWENLWSGAASKALVRVFCEASDERPEPFEDPARWTSFRLSGPELPHDALAFAETGTTHEAMIRRVVREWPGNRARLVLEIVRHDGMNGPLFEITRCVAAGWITCDQWVGNSWSQRLEN